MIRTWAGAGGIASSNCGGQFGVMMKRAGYDVWAETCPHYFLLTEEDYLRRGAALQVNPPLRSAEDRAAMYEAVRNGGIDFVSTDHAPHAPAEKAGQNPPSGIAGIEWLGPILLTLAKRGEIAKPGAQPPEWTWSP